MSESMDDPDTDQPNLHERTEGERKEYAKLSSIRDAALRRDVDNSHYWNNFTICWGKKANQNEGWLLRCKRCKDTVSARNVSDSVKSHMKSRNKCLGSYEDWINHERGTKKRQPSEAETQVFLQLHAQAKKSLSTRNRVISEYRFDQNAISKFLECFKTWILYNSTSASFRCVEDEKLTEALAALGYPYGICRKTLCTTFLDKKYEEFLAARLRGLNYYKCFQIAADSWKSKYVNESNKLVGVTLNLPEGCQLGDIFPSMCGETISGDYLFQKMKTLIDGLGREFYIGCVFDGESAYQSAGRRLKAAYPGTVHLTCQAHTLSLLLKHINEKIFPNCFDVSHAMVKLCNEKDCKKILQTFQKEAYGKTYKISIGIETRFGYFVTEMKDLLKSKSAIQRMAGDQNLRSRYNANNPRATDSQKMAFSNIDSDLFWGNLEVLADRLGPLVEIIEHIEQDKPMITQMFFVWRFLAHHFRVRDLRIEDNHGDFTYPIPASTESGAQQLSLEEKAMASAVRVRMTNTNTDIFCLAFLLDLRFYIQTGYNMFSPPTSHLTSHEIREAEQALSSIVPSSEKAHALKEFRDLMKEGIRIDVSSGNQADVCDSISFLIKHSEMPQGNNWKQCEGTNCTTYNVGCTWRYIERQYQIISTIAGNLFAIHVTSCSVERLWSRMRALYKPTRSRLNPERAKKLMMITLGRDFYKHGNKRKRCNDRKDGDLEEDGLILLNNEGLTDGAHDIEIDNLGWLEDMNTELELIPQNLINLAEEDIENLDIRVEETEKENQPGG